MGAKKMGFRPSPGAWGLERWGGAVVIGGQVIAEPKDLKPDGASLEEGIANARLMAFSKESYVELKRLIEDCTERIDREYSDGTSSAVEVICASEKTVARIRNLLSKIEGEDK